MFVPDAALGPLRYTGGWPTCIFERSRRWGHFKINLGTLIPELCSRRIPESRLSPLRAGADPAKRAESGSDTDVAYRITVFILLQHWSGFACMDAATRDRLQPDNNLTRVQRNKTGAGVYRSPAADCCSLIRGWSEPVAGRDLHPLKSSTFSRRTFRFRNNTTAIPKTPEKHGRVHPLLFVFVAMAQLFGEQAVPIFRDNSK